MISFKTKNLDDQCLLPVYSTQYSVGADLKSAIDTVLFAHTQIKIPTGIYIDQVDFSKVSEHMIPELQIRARSGLAFKHGITLTNGVGTIDCDYPEEICVLLWNTSSKDFTIRRQDRIAQLCLQLHPRMNLKINQSIRISGFGSTGI